ncbi:MAG: Ig-like domain-containing protein, partial [Cystobacter sp.]
VTLTQAPTAAFRDHTTYSLVAKSSKNQTPSSERKFTVDLKAPDATITSHPDAKTQSRSAKFDFTHDDVCSLLEYPSHCSSRGLFKDVTFRCVLDGVSSSNCDDGTITYYDLPDGEHTFEVQASDKVNTGALQRHSWTIDRTRPVVTLVGMPAARMGAGAAVFKFSADEVVKAFTCTHTAPGRSPTVTSCSSPKSYDALAEGIHKFQLVAEDVAGNVSNNLDAYTWVVDLTGPATVIDAKPPLLTNSKQARFEFTSESGATFECALDAKNYGPCASPKDYDLIANGRHTFYVRGSDDVGNKGPEREFSWEVDFIPPVTTFTDTPATLTSSNEARFVFSADKANVSYYCALTGRGNDGFELCGASGEKRYSNLLDGSYTFRVQAIDSLGNLEVVPVSHTWVVDTTPPKLVINKPADGGMSSTPYVTIEGESEAAIKVFLFFEGRAEPIQVLADSFNGSWQYKTDFPLAEKSHTLRVEVTDWAGRKTTQSIRFTVNTFRPETQIVSGPPAIYKSGVARFVFSAPNVPESRQDDVQFKCQFDGGPWSLCEQEQEYFKIKNGPHELQVSAWLEGNEDLTPAVYQWEVRIEPPSVPNILVPVHGGRVETGSPAISGTVIPNGSVLVFIKGVKSGIALADATGAWTFTPSPPLTPGEYVVEAEAEDELGNRSESRSPPVSFTFEPPSPIGGYGEGGGGLSCAAGGSLPGSMLLWVLMGFWAAGRRRC